MKYLVEYAKKGADGWPEEPVWLVFERSRDAYKCADLISRACRIDIVKVRKVEI